MSNVKTQKEWDFEQVLVYIHDYWFSECTLRGWDPRSLDPVHRKEIVAQIEFATATKPNLIDLYWTIINRGDEVWARVLKLVKGECHLKMPRLRSSNHFTPFNMSARIPDRAFCEILDRALNGYIETKGVRSSA